MDCCGLSLSGLKIIDENEIIEDNITIASKVNVSFFFSKFFFLCDRLMKVKAKANPSVIKTFHFLN
jgi:hypothetical protein